MSRFSFHTKFITSLEYTSNDSKNILVLKREKKELTLERSIQINSLLKAKEIIPENSPLFLIINTEKVLFKAIDIHIDAQKAIAEAFPNLKIEDFFYEILHTDKRTFLAICRKDDVNIILDDCQKNSLNVVGFSFGSLSISNVAQFIENKNILTSNSAISFDDNSVSSISTNSTPTTSKYIINGLEVTNDDVLSLAGAIGYYSNQKNTAHNFELVADELHSNFKQKRIFDVGLKVSLGSIFLLLLVSFLFFSNYNSKINTLNSEIELNKTYKNSLITLSNDVSKKESIVNDFSLASSKASWYADQIGSSIPSSILLTELQFRPLKKNIKKEEEIVLEQHQIVVKGKTRNNADFSSWTNNLERMSWVDKITIQEFGVGKKSITEFQLSIIYKN